LLKGQLLGDWHYYVSLIDNKGSYLLFEKHLPVYSMNFDECQDNKIKILPQRVRQMRIKNPFNGLCCTTYLNENVELDTYYPVLNTTIGKGVKRISVTNYGSLYKRDYFIKKITFDTLIIYDERYFFRDGTKHRGAKHIYIKRSG
tara:strand:+ start:1363 stop:1797 length:435 start_codon:yes stop_codon:yes gene_type:complete